MRLHSIELRQFGCVASGRVELGPGLNVLHGPNDLGKSTVAAAIRAALLLPTSSAEGERYVSWQGDELPQVVLTFESQPSHFHRVTKAFSRGGGSAQLEFSRDGHSWSVEARGRDVDGELRRLLRWGIPEPGGRGGPRGIPASFLGTVLLAPQDDVAGLLRTSLESDPDLSGKERIAAALEALGEDPLFARTREQVQEVVDSAFGSTGRKRTAQGTPFKVMSEQVQAARQDFEVIQAEVDGSRAVQGLVQQLTTTRLTAQQRLDEAKRRLERLAAARAAVGRHDAAQLALAQAEQRVADIESANQALEELAANEPVAKADRYEIEKRLAAATRRAEAAQSELEAARDQLRASVAEADNQSTSRRQGLEGRRDLLEAKEREARGRLAQAREALEHAQQVVGLEQKQSQQRARSSELESGADAIIEGLRRERDGLDGLARWLGLESARAELARATADRAQSDHLLEEASRLKALANRVERELAERPVPDRVLLADLRDLREKRRLAEARLEVGLTVRIEPRQPFALEVTRDGEPGPTQLQSTPITIEARQRLDLSLGALADLRIDGGDPAAREEANSLRQRWERSALPRFEAAGVESLEALEGLAEQVAEQSHEATERRREAERALERARDLGDVEAAVTRARERVREAESGLSGLDRTLLAERSAQLGTDPRGALEKRRRQVDASLIEAEAKSRERSLEVAGLEARIETTAEQLSAARREAQRRLDQLGGEPRHVLEAAALEADEASTERERTKAELAALEEAGEGPITAARQTVERAEAGLREAREAEESARRSLVEAETRVAALGGQLEERRRQAAAFDLEGTRSAVEAARAEAAACPAPAEPITDAELETAREACRLAESDVRDLEAQLDRARGALGQVGGSGAEERLSDAEDALQRVLERERELEDDLEAWRLLLQVLAEVEREESNHLGRALAGPVMAEFRELTRGRYASLVLGTGLETLGVFVGGQPRPAEHLSLGTQEQLATLLRLAVARQLGSMLVLDDQLVQSDPERAGHLNRLLREAGVQVVVLTARPRDYLDGAAADDGSIRAVDLSEVIERY